MLQEHQSKNLLQIGGEGRTFQHQSHRLGAAWINSHCEVRVKGKIFVRRVLQIFNQMSKITDLQTCEDKVTA